MGSFIKLDVLVLLGTCTTSTSCIYRINEIKKLNKNKGKRKDR